jgi:magnesium chelatase subunit D
VPTDDETTHAGAAGQAPDRLASPNAPTRVRFLSVQPQAAQPRSGLREVTSSGRRSLQEGPRGRTIGDRSAGEQPRSLAVRATVRQAALRARAGEQGAAALAIEADDLREAVRSQRVGNLVVLAVDASGSMGAPERMETAKGTVLSLLLDAYQRRDRVALVTFRGEGAEVILRPTGSVEVARARLASLPTGGRTPLAAGIDKAMSVTALARSGHVPLLVLVSDGRATYASGSDDPWQSALAAAERVRAQGVAAVVVDVERGPSRLGLAAKLSEAMGARHLTPEILDAGSLSATVRAYGASNASR